MMIDDQHKTTRVRRLYSSDTATTLRDFIRCEGLHTTETSSARLVYILRTLFMKLTAGVRQPYVSIFFSSFIYGVYHLVGNKSSGPEASDVESHGGRPVLPRRAV